MSEVVKLLTCLVFVYQEEGNCIRKTIEKLNETIIKQPIDTLKVCVPSLVYIVQNNLLYVSASHLDAATYQVTYQLKILTTAMFTVVILRRSLIPLQWGALVILLAGVVMVQLAHTDSPTLPSGLEQNRLLGFGAALSACVLSGFAGIYFEKILKGSDISVWMRNVQLSFLSLPFGLCTCLISDGNTIRNNGFFFGYNSFVWYLVVLQAGGGLIVAMVVKYADNILKGFATSLAIIISCIASVYLFNFQVTLQFVFGTSLVICSIFMYSHKPAQSETQSTHNFKV
ncbi:UDP-N-acetylglucosamine transporter [Blattella germanica]|nr:UDP-N-acetylglucosamine transporter [Blattella germanica]